jgi:hypothetical protein
MRGAIRAAAAAGLEAFAVGICEAICSIDCPQDEQNRLAACTSAEHFGQWTLPGFTAADYRSHSSAPQNEKPAQRRVVQVIHS